VSHGVVKDCKSRRQATLCPVCKGRRQQHRKPRQSNKGYSAAAAVSVIQSCSYFLQPSWNSGFVSLCVIIIINITLSWPSGVQCWMKEG